MEYCHKNNIILDEILEVKSSTKSQEKRKIKDLKQKLKSGDLLIATELYFQGLIEVCLKLLFLS